MTGQVDLELTTRATRPTLCGRTLFLAALLLAAPALAEEQAQKPCTLEECIDAALEANPSAQAAAHRIEAARRAARQTTAGYYPQFRAFGEYARTDNAPQAFMMTLNQRALLPDADFNNPDDTENLRVGMGAEWLLFDGGQRGLDRSMAGYGAKRSKAQLAALQNELIHEVQRAYYSVLRAQAILEVDRETVGSVEENLRVASARYDAGSTPLTDVLNLKVQRSRAREGLISSQSSVQLAVAGLNTAVGYEIATASAMPGDTRSEPPALPDEDGNAAAGRPELHVADLQVRAREKAWTKVRRGYAPSLSAFGTLDWDSDLSNEFEDSYFVGMKAEWTAFQGLQRPQASKEAKARWEAARSDLQALRNQFALDHKQAWLGARAAQGLLKVAEQSIKSADEALRITRQRYEEGAADVTELLNAQVGLTASRSRTVAAHYEYLISLSNVARSRGDLVRQHVQE